MAVLDIVIEILKINCSYVQCNYANPMEGLFNLVFFPSVFIILLIFMLANFVLGRAGITDNKLMQFLLSIAFFAFIIFQDLYTTFVALSTVWYFAIILLIGLWLILRIFFGPHRGEPHGYYSKSGGGGVGGAIGDFIGRKAMNVITKEEEDMEKEIRSQFNQLENAYKEVKNSPLGSEARGAAGARFVSISTKLEQLITEYGKKGKIGGINVTKQADKFWDEYTGWSNKYRNVGGE